MSDGALLSRDEFVERLRREGEARYHDHHRYHVLMHEGKLTRLQLQQWVLNRYYYQTRIPVKDALILSKSDDPAFRRWWIQRLHYEITYSWLYDFLSGRDYELLDTSLTFALDPKGHLGLTFSYRNGQLVETGQDVDLAKIALSVSY